MTEQHVQDGAGESVPPSDAAPEGRAEAAPAGDGGQAARAPLGEWRAPALWMACGALVAGLVGASVVLVQRVAMERDMMAVAATMPQPAPPSPAQAAAQSPAATPPGPMPANSPALRPPAARPAGHGRPVRRHAAQRQPAAIAQRNPGTPRAGAAKQHAKLSAQAWRNRAAMEAKYPEIFKRCPPLGKRGAAQCRRDICNGAEGRGPVCKPYVRKLP